MSHEPWKVSLHGGHSGEFCDHAQGTLEEILDAAVDFGYRVFGVSEHAPRKGEQYLYDTERAMGWDVAKLESDFERYAETIALLSGRYEGRLQVLRGFELEVVPPDEYVSIMQAYRKRFAFDYIVGSVHFLDDLPIDGPPELFARVEKQLGGLEGLALAYYEKVREMVEALRPEVVGHLDLVRKNAPSNEAVETPAIHEAAVNALEVIRDCGGILDVNTAGYRKGLGSPYPAPWLVEAARDMGVGFCFGDDSHAPNQVGAGIEDARDYLLDLGVREITVLARKAGAIVREKAPLP